ncbi:ABC transporter permease [Salicibibacter kimchii]|uniref:Transport permease protein n=1 Tax=Salicibibacter kimchii TaxID=2099786 RepID=A0A345C2R9_9BACI|nr:ABC transporter permease [Salicibibacter kimchii]AXF57500.1 ABC transporter permease [Salicibibacter kimchii]
MKLITDIWWVFIRYLRSIMRSPFIILMTVVQPVLWMFLFGQVFSSMAELPGFGGNSYMDFLGPGIVMMSTMMAGAYAGMGIISDYRDGVLDRFLISPIHRSSLLLGGLLQDALTMTLQALIMIGVAMLLGTQFSGGLSGILLLILIAVVLGLVMGALSMSVGLIVRQEKSLTAAVGFTQLPLLFLSGLFMPLDLVPGWIETAAAFNPLNWAVEAGREVVGTQTDGGLAFQYGSYLLVMFIISCLLVLGAFRVYQRSL